MKLYGYELLKLSKKKTLWVVILVMLAASCYLFLDGQRQNQILIENRTLYEQTEAEVQTLSLEEAVSFLQEKVDEIQVRVTLLGASEGMENAEIFLEDIMTRYPKLYEQLAGKEETLSEEELYGRSIVYNELLRQAQSMQKYPEFIATVEQNAQTMLKASVFGKPGTFSYNTILKTASDFSHMEDVPLEYGLSLGITAATDFFPNDLFLLLIVFLLCVYLYNWEWERGLYPLVKSGRNGRLAVIGAKLGVLFTGTVLCAALFYGAALLGSGLLYGFGDWNRYIQSMSDFRDCNILLTVGQYLFWAFGIKVAALLLAGVILSALFLYLKNAAPVYFAVVVFFGGSWALYTWVPASFQLNHVKYINLFSLLDSYGLLSRYTNLNFFSQPVNLNFLWLILLPVLLCGLLVLCGVKFARDRQVARHSRLAALFERAAQLWRKGNKSAYLFPQEGFKLLVQGKIILVLLVAVYLGVNTVTGYSPPRFGQKEATYRSYLITLSGEPTEEKAAFLAKEQAQFDEIPVRMQEIQNRFERGEIDGHEKYMLEKQIELTLGVKQEGYQMVLRDQRYLERLAEGGMEGGYVDQITADAWFDDSERELQSTALFLVLCIVCLGNVFCIDSRKGVVRLLRCTKYGQEKLLRVKYWWSLLIALFLYLCCFLPNFLNLIRGFGIPNLDIPLQSIQFYAQADGGLSVGGFLILAEILRFLGLWFCAMTVLAFSAAVKSYFLTVLLSGGLLVVPVLLQMLGINLRQWSISSCALLYDRFAASGGWAGYLIYAVCLLLLTAGLAIWTRHSFTGKWMGGKTA